MCCIYNSVWRGLAALLILGVRQCEGLRLGMSESRFLPMPFLFPCVLRERAAGAGGAGGRVVWIKHSSYILFIS